MSCLELKKIMTFSISPREFCAMSWIYQREILPALRNRNFEKMSLPDNFDYKEWARTIRLSILNKEFNNYNLSYNDMCLAKEKIPNYLIFLENESGKKMSLSNEEKEKARNFIADLIFVKANGEFCKITSLSDGMMNFTIG